MIQGCLYPKVPVRVLADFSLLAFRIWRVRSWSENEESPCLIVNVSLGLSLLLLAGKSKPKLPMLLS